MCCLKRGSGHDKHSLFVSSLAVYKELENIFIHHTVKMKAAIISTYFTIVLLAPSNVLTTKLS